jgi:hypothetical protein
MLILEEYDSNNPASTLASLGEQPWRTTIYGVGGATRFTLWKRKGRDRETVESFPVRADGDHVIASA